MPEPHAIAVFALELADGHVGVDALSTDAAMELGECLAHDLARVAPAAAECDLVFAGAHFDPAEALRPGWPLHRRLLSRWGNRYTGIVLGLGVHDCTSGFRAYRADALAGIEPGSTSAEGYAFLTELVRRLERGGARLTSGALGV